MHRVRDTRRSTDVGHDDQYECRPRGKALRVNGRQIKDRENVALRQCNARQHEGEHRQKRNSVLWATRTAGIALSARTSLLISICIDGCP